VSTTARIHNNSARGRQTIRLPTNPVFIIPPHVIPYGVQVSFDKVRKVIVDLARRRSSLRPNDPSDKAGDPARQPISGSSSGGGGGGGGGGGSSSSSSGGGGIDRGGRGGSRATSTAQ